MADLEFHNQLYLARQHQHSKAKHWQQKQTAEYAILLHFSWRFGNPRCSWVPISSRSLSFLATFSSHFGFCCMCVGSCLGMGSVNFVRTYWHLAYTGTLADNGMLVNVRKYGTWVLDLKRLPRWERYKFYFLIWLWPYQTEIWRRHS